MIPIGFQASMLTTTKNPKKWFAKVSNKETCNKDSIGPQYISIKSGLVPMQQPIKHVFFPVFHDVSSVSWWFAPVPSHLHLGLSATLILIQDIQAIGAEKTQHRADRWVVPLWPRMWMGMWMKLATAQISSDMLDMLTSLKTSEVGKQR